MNSEILEKTYNLVDEIKSLKSYKRLKELHEFIKKDSSLNELIKSFDSIKNKYGEVTKYGKHHPDLKKVQIELSKKKEEVFGNPIIREYKSLEKGIQKKLDTISREIALNVSNKIKYPNELGLINKH